MVNKTINLESKDFIRTFFKNIGKKSKVLLEEERELLQIVDNEERSKEFFKKNIKKIR